MTPWRRSSLLRNFPKAPIPVLAITAEVPPSLETSTALLAGDPPRYRLKVDALLSVSVFWTEMKSTAISPMVRTSRGSVSGAIDIQSN